MLSDGVTAIVITLLVLTLQVPDLPRSVENGVLWEQIINLFPNMIAYFISFMIIGKYWQIHTYLLRHIKSTTYQLIWINILFLFFLSFLPFPTALLGKYDNMVSLIGFDICIALPAIMLAFSTSHIFYSKHFEEEIDEKKKNPMKLAIWKLAMIPAISLISILLSLYSVTLGSWAWVLIILLFLVN